MFVLSLVATAPMEPKKRSLFRSSISASFWFALFIYLFLRKIRTGVAKNFRMSKPMNRQDWADGNKSEGVSENDETTIANNSPETETVSQYFRSVVFRSPHTCGCAPPCTGRACCD
jgi:hypothetical protein